MIKCHIIFAIELKNLYWEITTICIVRFYIFYAYFRLRCHDAAFTFMYFLARPMQHLESISSKFIWMMTLRWPWPILWQNQMCLSVCWNGDYWMSEINNLQHIFIWTKDLYLCRIFDPKVLFALCPGVINLYINIVFIQFSGEILKLGARTAGRLKTAEGDRRVFKNR